MPEQSLPPAWKSSVSPSFWRSPMTSSDPGRHHVDQHVSRTELRRRNHLALPRVARLPEAILADEVRVHLLRHLAERRPLTEVVEIRHEASR
ncbi:MAG: hypothetical protein DMD81_19045 [Candidatus Rokuibacteriota bacterium]|nr:MAG: hypothetical protein DMD81_19045 [Candidatus Rokubacteria bacterium]